MHPQCILGDHKVSAANQYDQNIAINYGTSINLTVPNAKDTSYSQFSRQPTPTPSSLSLPLSPPLSLYLFLVYL